MYMHSNFRSAILTLRRLLFNGAVGFGPLRIEPILASVQFYLPVHLRQADTLKQFKAGCSSYFTYKCIKYCPHGTHGKQDILCCIFVSYLC